MIIKIIDFCGMLENKLCDVHGETWSIIFMSKYLSSFFNLYLKFSYSPLKETLSIEK